MKITSKFSILLIAYLFFCLNADGQITTPDKINLGEAVRVEEFQSSLGKVQIRWPRTTEETFKRTPIRAVNDAVETVSRAIKTSAFPSFIQNMNENWKIVFIDSKSAATQVPVELIKNCHPGWMTPPANIYIATDIIGGECQNTRKNKNIADSDLAEILIHEFGHVIEYALLRNATYLSRARAEGFASWFEIFAAKYSSLISPREIKDRTIKMARLSSTKGAEFDASAADYARFALYFEVLVAKKGITTLMEIYKAIALEKLDFFSAVKEKAYWNESQLEAEVAKISGSK